MKQKVSFAWGFDGNFERIFICCKRKKLLGMDEVIPVSQWTSPPLLLLQASLITRLRNEGTFFQSPEDLQRLNETFYESDKIWPSIDFLLNLNEAEARALGLPPATSLTLELKSHLDLTHPNFRIEHRWLNTNRLAVRAQVMGVLIKADGEFYRLPKPLYRIYQAAKDLFETGLDESQRFSSLAALKEMIPDELSGQISWDAYLEPIRIQYAQAFSLKISPSEAGFQFDPVLFSRRSIDQAAQQGILPDEDLDSLLTPAEQEEFTKQFAKTTGIETRAGFVLAPGFFVYLDPSIQRPLREVRRLQLASPEERKRFITNPRLVLTERLGEEAAETIETVFVETEQFSARVSGIDIWRKRVLPWIKPNPRTWLPEEIGVRIQADSSGSDTLMTIAPEDIPVVRRKLQEAMEVGKESIEWNGKEIPATPQALSSLDVLQETCKLASAYEEVGEEEKSVIHDKLISKTKAYFLTVLENFDNQEVTLSETLIRHIESIDLSQISGIETNLKNFQKTGVEWFARNILHGRPGALLADDMGLGKTLQALAGLAWWREWRRRKNLSKLPALIVTPAGLTQNWRDELAKHFSPDCFPEIVLANRSWIRGHIDNFTGTDIRHGRSLLDVDLLRKADIIITSYETLRDYHFSFARVRFGVVIFDEAQKLKNPTAQLTRAAKTLNAEFRLALTGTPVENRLHDIWSITDVIWPGRLGSSREFAQKYKDHDPDAGRKLRMELSPKGEGSAPPVMLRRMKTDHLGGLPRKTVRIYEEDMPKRQAERYLEVVREAWTIKNQQPARGTMLQIIQKLRSTSLHPAADALNAEEEILADDHAAFIQNSARLVAAMRVLDEIQRKREKALIFCEDRRIQSLLASHLRYRYRLPGDPSIINGDIPSPVRQRFVDRFQEAPAGFDVMILSPKAGGVGLTLTAANHVIHLTRWWNPAVEDQANDRVYRIGQDKPVFIHIPLAIHPDPNYRPFSFDTKLHELLEEKRRRAQDVLMPGETEEDIHRLFDNIVPHEMPRLISVKKSDTLTDLSKDPEDSFPRVITISSDNPINFDKIFKPLHDKFVKSITIRDPYCLARRSNRQKLGDFMAELLDHITCPAEITIIALSAESRKLRDKTSESCAIQRRETREILWAAGVPKRNHIKIDLKDPPPREDFHDRWIDFHITVPRNQLRLLISSGIDYLMRNRECTLTWQKIDMS